MEVLNIFAGPEEETSAEEELKISEERQLMVKGLRGYVREMRDSLGRDLAVVEREVGPLLKPRRKDGVKILKSLEVLGRRIELVRWII